VIYTQRREVLNSTDLREQILRMVQEEINGVVTAHTPGPDPEDWDMRSLYGELRTFFPLPTNFDYHTWQGLLPSEIEAQLVDLAEQAYDDINRNLGHQMYRQARQKDMTLKAMSQSVNPAQRMIYQRLADQLEQGIEENMAAQPLRRLSDEMEAQIEEVFIDTSRLFRDRQLMLRAVDGLWVRHLTDLAALREGIGLRAYGQQNPLVAYRKEAHEMYATLLSRIQKTVARSIYLMPRTSKTQPKRQLRATHPRRPSRKRAAQPARAKTSARPDHDLGRNDPCWCGSGQKYKYCHMRQDRQQRRS